MTLLDEAEATRGIPSGSRCSMALLHERDPQLAAELEEVLASHHRTSIIARLPRVKAAGIRESTLARHRKRGCQCP